MSSLDFFSCTFTIFQFGMTLQHVDMRPTLNEKREEGNHEGIEGAKWAPWSTSGAFLNSKPNILETTYREFLQEFWVIRKNVRSALMKFQTDIPPTVRMKPMPRKVWLTLRNGGKKVVKNVMSHGVSQSGIRNSCFEHSKLSSPTRG